MLVPSIESLSNFGNLDTSDFQQLEHTMKLISQNHFWYEYMFVPDFPSLLNQLPAWVSSLLSIINLAVASSRRMAL